MGKDSLAAEVKDAETLAQTKEEILNAVKPENVKEGLDVTIDKMSLFIEKSISMLVDSIPSLVKAILTLIIGLFIIRTVLKILRKRFEARNVDMSLRGFLMSIIKFILYALLILMVASNLGFQTTAILGALSGLVLAAGLALQGSLSNFAGGVLVLLFRPFEVGDYIENSAGTEGTVEKIDLLYTTLSNSQGIKVFSPNGALANSVIRNFSKISKRRIDFQLGISYDDNIKEVKQVIERLLDADTRVLKTPKPEIVVKELTSSGVVLTIRTWAAREDFASLSSEIQDMVKKAVYEGGFKNPFATTTFHIVNHSPDPEKNN